MPYIKEKFERKQYWILWLNTRSGLKIPVFSNIAPVFCIIVEKSANKLHCNNASWMATRKQVSDTLKSILPTKQMQISSLYKNTRKYKYHCGSSTVCSSLFDVFVFDKTKFLQTNCHFFITKHKEFLKHKESPLDLALFFFFKILTALNEVLAYKAQQFLSSTYYLVQVAFN